MYAHNIVYVSVRRARYGTVFMRVNVRGKKNRFLGGLRSADDAVVGLVAVSERPSRWGLGGGATHNSALTRGRGRCADTRCPTEVGIDFLKSRS